MNVLLSRPDRVGDVVISTTLIPALRATAGMGRISFLGREAVRALIAPMVDDFVAIEMPDLAGRVRDLRVDVSLHLHPHADAASACFAAGVSRRIGYDAEADRLTETLPYQKSRGDRHEAEYGFELAARISVRPPARLAPLIRVEPRPDLFVSGQRALAIHVGASGEKARLPEALLLQVARAWLRAAGPEGTRIMWLGSADERVVGDRLAGQLGGDESVNLCGALTLPELAGVAGAATVFMGRDSGPAHLAAAAGGRVVVVFPAARADMSVARWRPLGDRVTIFEVPGRARWWEKTEYASRRLFARIRPEALAERVIEAASC